MKYFIIAGEQSGDLHGSNLIRGLKSSDPEAVILCWGGDMMKEAGGELLMHYRKLAFMGFVTVLMNIRTVMTNMSLCRKHLRQYMPDVVILIDYPGFNLRIAEYSKSLGLKVFYYISPKLWAWKEGRITKVRKFVDRMFIIFPFEVDFYGKHGIPVEYFGNPLADEVEKRMKLMGSREDLKKSLGLDGRPVISMLAGSRSHEVQYILPEMIKMVKYFNSYQFVIAAVKNLPEKLYMDIIGNLPVRIITDRTYEILRVSEAALVKSGTSTLEAALFGVPQVVCYKGDKISFSLARLVVKIRVFSLVNLIMGREVVRELIQFLLTEKNLLNELIAILPGGSKRERMLTDYDDLRKIVGPAGASDRIASEMVRSLIKDIRTL